MSASGQGIWSWARAWRRLSVGLALDARRGESGRLQVGDGRFEKAGSGGPSLLERLLPVPRGDGRAAQIGEGSSAVGNELAEQLGRDPALMDSGGEGADIALAGEGMDQPEPTWV